MEKVLSPRVKHPNSPQTPSHRFRGSESLSIVPYDLFTGVSMGLSSPPKSLLSCF